MNFLIRTIPGKLLQIFNTDLLPIRFIQAWACFLFSYVLLLPVDFNANLLALLSLPASEYIHYIFFAMGAFHLIGCFFRVGNSLRICFSLVNMYMWSYALLVFVFYTRLTGSELLLFLPWWCEFWIFTGTLTRSLSLGDDCSNWRRNND
jgi:hypothetical protein